MGTLNRWAHSATSLLLIALLGLSMRLESRVSGAPIRRGGPCTLSRHRGAVGAIALRSGNS
jgi:hypothetical protein